MKFGLSETSWKLVEQIALEPLKRTGAQVFVFGSRARGDHYEFSDLDLLVFNLKNAKLLSGIKEQLEESSLPIRVDIVLNEDLADSYRNNVDSEKIKIE
ncbi:MAG: nucleotidyltransferase domain-containing protein [Bdellovibrionota bacterium]